MAISVKVRKEAGALLQALEGPYIPRQEVYGDPSAFPMMGGIDPYANTIFNERQVERLLAELSMLYHLSQTDEQREAIKGIMDLCEVCQSGRHRYLWFIGD